MACAEAVGPRVCAFRASGTVVLNSPIMVRSSVHIAGQTAPGPGIQLRLGTSTHGPLIIKGVSDVVVRFLKTRPGTGPDPHLIDAVTREDSQRVYLGNLSLGFATDETFNVHVSSGTVTDVTLADSVLAYSLDKVGHPNGDHSKGAPVSSGLVMGMLRFGLDDRRGLACSAGESWPDGAARASAILPDAASGTPGENRALVRPEGNNAQRS